MVLLRLIGGDGSEPSMVTTQYPTGIYKTHTYSYVGKYIIKISIDGSANIVSATSSSEICTKGSVAYVRENYIYLNCLKAIYIGNNIGISTCAFTNCYSLAQITIPKNITSIGSSAFKFCYALKHIILPNTVTSISDNAFESCMSLKKILMPNSISSIGLYVFQYCYTLPEIIIPKSVNLIATYTFMANYSLSCISIPDTVTGIAGNVFPNCYGLGFIKFTSTTPPTVANSNAWSGVPTDCKILVPQGTLETYKAAQNYPNPNTYTYEEYTE